MTVNRIFFPKKCNYAKKQKYTTDPVSKSRSWSVLSSCSGSHSCPSVRVCREKIESHTLLLRMHGCGMSKIIKSWKTSWKFSSLLNAKKGTCSLGPFFPLTEMTSDFSSPSSSPFSSPSLPQCHNPAPFPINIHFSFTFIFHSKSLSDSLFSVLG